MKDLVQIRRRLTDLQTLKSRLQPQYDRLVQARDELEQTKKVEAEIKAMRRFIADQGEEVEADKA